MHFNVNIPRLKVLIRAEFLYAFKRGHGKYESAIAHAVCCLSGRALGFHVLLDNGAHIGRLPIHALVQPGHGDWQNRWGERPLNVWQLQLWDCFSYHAQCVEYDYLDGMRCRVALPDQKWYGGEYLFTIDYAKSAAAEDAGDEGWKCHHIIALDCGLYAAQPNNRCCFYEPSLVQPFDEPPKYKTMPRTWKTEDGSKWRTSDDDRMFYDVEAQA